MTRYLIFNETGIGMAILIADHNPSEDRKLLCTIAEVDTTTFAYLWNIIEARYKRLKGTDNELAMQTHLPFKAYISNKTDYVIEYDTSMINKLIGLFSLIKAWAEFNYCNELELKELY